MPQSLLQTLRSGSSLIDQPFASPMGVASAGGNQNQAKMANLSSAVDKAGAAAGTQSNPNLTQTAAPVDNNLLTTLRQYNPANAAALTGQTQEVQNASAAANLSDIGTRVTQKITNEINSLTSSAQTSGLGGTPILTPGFDAVGAINTLIQNPTDYSTLAKTASALGMALPTTPAEIQRVMDALSATVPQRAADLAGATAGIIQANTKLNETDYQELGFKSEQEVADLLGISINDLSQMSAADVVQHAVSALQTQYNSTSSLKNKLNDPMVGAAEKAEAHAQLIQAGAVGVGEAEANAAKLADHLVNTAETVQIEGKDVAINTLLSSDYISGLAKSYYDNTMTDKAGFMRDHPDLAKFFDTYSSVLSTAVSNLEPAVADYATLQQNNMDLNKTKNGDILSSDIMTTLYPDYGKQLSYALATTPIISALKGTTGLTDTQIHDLYTSISSLSSISALGPSFLSSLNNMSEGELRNAGFLDQTSQAWKDFQDKLTLFNMSRNPDIANTLASSDDGLAHIVGATSYGDIQAAIDEATMKVKSGQYGDLPVSLSKFSTSGLSSYFTSLQNQTKDFSSIREIADMNNNIRTDFAKLQTFNSQADTPELKLLKPYIDSSTSTVTSSSIPALANSASLDDLHELLTTYTGKNTLFTPTALSSLKDAYVDKYNTNIVQPALSAIPSSDALNSLGSSIPSMSYPDLIKNKEIVESYINQINSAKKTNQSNDMTDGLWQPTLDKLTGIDQFFSEAIAEQPKSVTTPATTSSSTPVNANRAAKTPKDYVHEVTNPQSVSSKDLRTLATNTADFILSTGRAGEEGTLYEALKQTGQTPADEVNKGVNAVKAGLKGIGGR